MDFTDELVEQYVTEAYVSTAAANEQDRLAAEQAFNNELKNGPMKTFTMADGRTFQKPIGTFDLDNFHKAYDEYFNSISALDLFNDQGKLINSATYGSIKVMDIKKPAVKALRTLWGAQFKNEMRITNLPGQAAAQAKWAAEKAAKEAEQKKQYQDILDLTNRVEDEVRKAVEAMPEWKDLLSKYSEEEQKKIVPEVGAYVIFHHKRGKLAIVKVDINIKGVLVPPVKTPGYARVTIDTDNIISVEDAIKAASDPAVIKPMLDMISKVTTAANFFVSNFDTLTRMADYKLLEDKFSWICFYDKANEKFYQAELKNFGGKKGLMLIDTSDPTRKTARLTSLMIVVAARLNEHSSKAYSGLYEREYDDYFVSKFLRPDVAKFLGVVTETKESAGNCDPSILVTAAEAPYNQEFDKVSKYFISCDSSD